MDNRRAEFRRWLDYEGILDAFTKLFVTLYEEPQWPDDATGYARGFFGSTTRAEIDEAVAENTRLKEEVKAVEQKIEEAKKRLDL